jgi:type 1 fimbria pilin
MAGSCETEVSRRVFNPAKSLQAITMVTDCGATTSPSYGVRLVESSDTTDEGIPDNTILGSNRGVGIRWTSNDTLLITGADTTNGYIMKTHLKLKKTNTEIIIRYID